jgi:hypothetical protein
MKPMDAAQVIALLDKQRGQREWKMLAAEIGISESFLSRVRNGQCGPGPKILAYLGLREEIRYVKAGQIQ